jgi:L-malate glycosyltransferase
MRIGIISNIAEAWGGSEELWRSFAIAAIKEKHHVIISYNKTGHLHWKMEELLNLGATVIGRRGFVKPGLPIAERLLNKGLIILKNEIDDPYKSFLKEQPDIVIYNDSSYNFSRDKFFLRMVDTKRAPVFIINQVIPDQYHAINESEKKKAIYVFSRAKKSFFVAERNIRTAERQLACKIPAAEVVRNPVNINHPELLSFPTLETVRLASVANMLVNHKAQDILLEALSMVSFKNDDWQLEFYGSGIDADYINDLIRYFGLSQKAFIRGKTNAIEAIWKNNHMLVMPSLMEGTPLAMVEAMLCGRLVLMSDVGGSREWIKDGKNGYLCGAASAIDLANTLEKAYAEREKWQLMSKSAFETAIELYDPHPGSTLLNKILSTT